MNRKIFTYEPNSEVSAKELSIYSRYIELVPGKFSDVNPLNWNTKSDYIQGTRYNEGDIIALSIDRNYQLYAEWPALSVDLIYNSFDRSYTKVQVELDKRYMSAEVSAINDSTYGFVSWTDHKGNFYRYNDLIQVYGSTDLFASCHYVVSVHYDLNGGYLAGGNTAKPQTAICQRYVSSDYDNYEDPGEIYLTADIPLKRDGSHFKWWKIGSCYILHNEPVQITSNMTALAEYVFTPIYQFTEEKNINDAGIINASPVSDIGNYYKKSYTISINDGYKFDKWEVTTFNGSTIQTTLVYSQELDVFLPKIADTATQITIYARAKAIFSYDGTWTRVYDINDNMTAYRINGIARNSIMPMKGNTRIKKVEFASTVTGIEEKLFSGCTALEEVKMASSCRIFGDSVFEGCINLKNISFS